jgi:hypothetical protein
MTSDFVLVLALKQIDTVHYKGYLYIFILFYKCIYRILHMRIIYTV